jgi:hypothetical protein
MLPNMGSNPDLPVADSAEDGGKLETRDGLGRAGTEAKTPTAASTSSLVLIQRS